MNQRDRTALRALLDPQLPENYHTSKWDDFVDYDSTPGLTLRSHSQGSCRVVRFVGPGRCLMVFDFVTGTKDPHWRGRDYKVRYLNEHNELVLFDPLTVTAKMVGGWDKRVGEWLVAHGARVFKGRGWKEDLSMKVLHCIRRWEKYYSGITRSQED